MKMSKKLHDFKIGQPFLYEKPSSYEEYIDAALAAENYTAAMRESSIYILNYTK